LLAEPWIRGSPDPHFAWLSTALFSTLAGNLTLIGSVANIIVVETTSSEKEIDFVRYCKAGIPRHDRVVSRRRRNSTFDRWIMTRRAARISP
jgi:hypothetical protein